MKLSSLRSRVQQKFGALIAACKLVFVILFFGFVAVAIIHGVREEFFPQDWMKVDYLGWKRSPRGRLELVGATITNTYKAKLKDFVVSCETKGNSGTVIETVAGTPLYESIKSGRVLTVESLDIGPISDQASNLKCWVSAASK